MVRKKDKYIIEESFKLFLQFGVQHVTMDDIAEKCSISKKTIYKYFENKNELLHHILINVTNEIKLKDSLKKFPNAIIELQHFFKNVNSLIEIISPSFIHDIKKFYPNIFLEIELFKNTVIIPFIKENIIVGINEKLYKENLNVDQISNSYDIILKIIFFDNSFYNFNNTKQTIMFLNDLYLHRLVSKKGFKYL